MDKHRKNMIPARVLAILSCLLAASGAVIFLSESWLRFLALVLWGVAVYFIALSLSVAGASRPGRLGALSRIARAALIILAALFAVSFTIVECAILRGARSEADKSAKYAVVLGAGLNGSRLSLALRSRMDEAYDYLIRNPDTVAVMSGSQGEGETRTEASAMAEYLIERGISPGRIIKEEESHSTEQNFIFTKAVISGLEGSDAPVECAVITNEFHMARSTLLARRYGLIPVAVPARTPLLALRISSYLREYFAYMNTYLNLGLSKTG